MAPAHEVFPALTAVPFLRHGFTTRVHGIEVKVDRAAALARLDAMHLASRMVLGIAEMPLVLAEQIHGSEIARADAALPAPATGADGLITATPGLCLGIYVADCCAVFLVDPERRAIGLVHSGKKGTELGIVPAAIDKMRTEFGCEPARMIAQLSPCIRRPAYEIDFAADIRRQCAAAGLRQIHDPGTCTASHLERYYSYRAELGKTGRMLALLAFV